MSLAPANIGLPESEELEGLKLSTDNSTVTGAKVPSGTMDGKNEPATKIDEIKKALEPYQQRYGHYLTKMRGWTDFFRLSASMPTKDNLKARLEENLTYFQINYALVFLLLMLFSIVMNPGCLVTIAVLSVAWVAFLKKNDDPEWSVVVAGLPLGKTHRWLGMCIISAIAFLFAAGNLVFSTAGVCGVVVLLHASFRPTALELGEERAGAVQGGSVDPFEQI